jgi:hypothetical protein
MSARLILSLVTLLAVCTSCAARSRRIAERGPKHEVRVSNTCTTEMRVYVDDEIQMRGQLFDISYVLAPATYATKKLYAGSHRIVMFPTSGSSSNARQITFEVTGPARIRICS